MPFAPVPLTPGHDCQHEEFADNDILARIERIIRCRTGGKIEDLRVDQTEDGIVIYGRAYAYYVKQQATHAALNELTAGVLTNRIEVV